MAAAPGDARTRLLRKVHVAVRSLGWSDETYRDLLCAQFGVESAGTLGVKQLQRLVDALRAKGWKPRKPKAGGRSPESGVRGPESAATDHGPGTTDGSPYEKKITALWLALRDAGALRDASPAALRRWVERQTGVASPRWLDDAQARAVVEALKGWCRRVGAEVQG